MQACAHALCSPQIGFLRRSTLSCSAQVHDVLCHAPQQCSLIGHSVSQAGISLAMQDAAANLVLLCLVRCLALITVAFVTRAIHKAAMSGNA